MKKILGATIIAALAAGVSAYAANPFADVSTSDWAYQAVSDLSSQGIVEGYPDGTFKGQTNITRYEMAQIVARLMAKEDQYNAEQRATIDKLAGEYADELDSLGVKVSNLEKKVGNISWSGDARMRYQRGLANFYDDPITDERKDTYDGRFRLNVEGAVNDQVTVKGRFLSEFDFQDGNSANTEMDRLHVVYAPNERTTIDIGRTDLWLGQTGVLYDDAFDGIKASYNTEHFGIEAGYGRMRAMSERVGYWITDDLLNMPDLYYVQANGKVGTVQLNAFYLDFVNDSLIMNAVAESGYKTDTKFKVWGIGTAIGLNDKLLLDGEYIQNPNSYTDKQTNMDKPTLWTAGLTYGKVDTENVGSWSIGVRYVDVDKLAYFGGSTLDMTNYLDASFDAYNNKAPAGVYGYLGETYGAKFWLLKAGVAIAKNVELDAYYYFNGRAKMVAPGSRVNEKEFDDIYGIELNYTF